MPTRILLLVAFFVLVIGGSLSSSGCKKSKDPTIAHPGDSPHVVATGIRQRIEHALEDTTRREALFEAMDEIDAALADVSKALVISLDTLARDDVDLRLQMRDLLTEEEWNQISSGVPR